jgi:hypothetical protein
MKVFLSGILLITVFFGLTVNLSAEENGSTVNPDSLFLYNNAFMDPSLSFLSSEDDTIDEPVYKFSVGRCLGAGLLNIFFGVGSFTMGDWRGGLLTLALEGGGIGLTLLGFAWLDSMGAEEALAFGILPLLGTGIAIIGITSLVVGIIYGFAAPFEYRKTTAVRTARLDDLKNWDIGLVSFENGSTGGRIAFTAHF